MAREHIRAFKDVPGVTLAGITNRTREKAESLATEFGIPVVSSGIDRLYAETQADVVQVSLYETAIHGAMQRVLSHPWTVQMEKPIGLNVLEAEGILSDAKREGRKVYAGLNRRTLSSTVAVLQDLAEHPEPRYIHVQDQQSLAIARSIGHDPAVVKNWMYANSIHLVDYLLVFGRGTIEELAVLKRWDEADPGVVLAKVVFSSGNVALYEAIWNGPGPWACSVSTPRRRWELRPLERASYQNAGTRTIIAVEPDGWDKSFKPGFRRQAGQVVAAWRGEKNSQATIEEGVAAMRLVSRIYEC